jgi:hypothetical protein
VDQTLSFIGVGVHTEPKNVSVLFPHMCTWNLFQCNGLCLIILQMNGHVMSDEQILHILGPEMFDKVYKDEQQHSRDVSVAMWTKP